MKKTVPVVGMACASCSANVENKLRSLPGINDVSVSLIGRSVMIDYDESKISLEAMKKEINSIGYDLVIETGRSVETIRKQEYSMLVRKTLLSIFLSVASMAISMRWLNIGDLDQTNQVCLLIAFANMFFCGRAFYVNSVRQLLHGVANMDTLVALSTCISFLFSAWNAFLGDPSLTYFDSCGMIISFVLLGRLLEERAKDSTASSIRKLMGMAPKTAHVVEDGELREVPVSTIDVGDILEVRPGERVPVDGEVISAQAS